MKINIVATLSDADHAAIKEAVTIIEGKLPFLINLEPEDRKKLFKLGNKSLAFVRDSLTAAKNNPQILPPSLSRQEFESVVDLAEKLTDIRGVLLQLTSKVDDTLMAAGSDAINTGTEVYNYVKTAAKRQPGLKPVAEQLGARFVKSPRVELKKAA